MAKEKLYGVDRRSAMEWLRRNKLNIALAITLVVGVVLGYLAS